ncbi:MAG: response regulator [Desulfobacteraceae bacterium]|nr:response regulator [Desulfobacteraceae bacterium]
MSKVLAVDNDTFILEFMKDILTNEGHEVMTAEDGLSAVDILETYVPDIIFVDLIMPNIDGKRLCKIIRGMRKLENVFLVILSATVLEDEIDTETLGVDVCIPKGPLNEMAQNVLSALNLIEAAAPPSLPSVILGGENFFPRAITGELISVKRHLEAIFEKISEGILEVTKNGRIVYVNPAALSIIGLPEEKLLASRFTDVFSEDYHQTVTRLIEADHEGAVHITEDPLISLNEHLLTVKALPVDNDASTAVIILHDVTKQKEAEETLRQRNRELELLNLAGRTLNSSLDLDHVLVTVLEELRRLIDVSRSTIWLVDPVSGELVCREAIGISREVLNGWRLEPE